MMYWRTQTPDTSTTITNRKYVIIECNHMCWCRFGIRHLHFSNTKHDTSATITIRHNMSATIKLDTTRHNNNN